MASRKRFQSRKVFILHGMLLVAVLVVAYFSARAQYDALRDQQIEENRIEQESSTRATSQSIEQNFRVLLTALPYIGEDQSAVSLIPKEFVVSVGSIDRITGKFSHMFGEPFDQFREVIGSNQSLCATTQPAVHFANQDADQYVFAAIPSRDSASVRVAVLSGEKMAESMAILQPRAPRITAYLGTEEEGLIGGVGPDGGERSLEHVLGEEQLIRTVRSLIRSGTVGGQVKELPDPRGLSIITLKPFAPLPGLHWYVLMIRTRVDEEVGETLRPLVWQLASGAGLMVAAVAIVFFSTTMSLRQGRRRIEQLRADMLDRDLQKARRIQLNWLPTPLSESPVVSIAAENQPAAHISGDLYNWFELPVNEDDRCRQTVVVMGDVSGHGLPAAFLMATTQMIVRNSMPSLRDPGACLSELNRQLCSLVFGGQFVTILIMVIRHDDNVIEIASAGQAPPLLRHGGDVNVAGIDPQLVVGVENTMEYQTHRLAISPGDSLLLYTDGVVETLDPASQQFGMDRLIAAYADAPSEPLPAIHSILGAIAAHRQGEEASDDLTLVAIQVKAVS